MVIRQKDALLSNPICRFATIPTVTNVSKSKNLYIDSDGVRRGYYVYVHKDRATGTVFYVGKGNGRRAWDSTQRNEDWKEHVASLPSGWDVEIIQDDLSEIEAFELEAELVEKYGGAAATGGILKNWIPGGEDPASIRIEVQLDDNVWSAAYYDARKFKNLSRRDEEAIAASANDMLEPIAEILSDLDDEADEHDDTELFDSVFTVESVIGGIIDASTEFQRRRISWKDFGMAMEEGVEDLESELEDIEEHHPKVRPLLNQAVPLIKSLLIAMDSGNREDAEEFANRKVAET